MAGKIHRHTYEDDSGKCCRCKKEHSPHVFEQSICITCGMTCNHTWNSSTGKCSLCEISCVHDWNNAPECKICGKECPHNTCLPESTTMHRCSDCNTLALHLYRYGESECYVCGRTCSHYWWPVGEGFYHECRHCHAKCYHENATFYSDYSCRCGNCEMTISHKTYNSTSEKCGTCRFCGSNLGQHDFYEGYCEKCNYKCLHPSVSNNVCNICGMTVDTE